MVVSSGFLIAGLAVLFLGIFIFSIRSYDPYYGLYYWGTLLLLGLIIVIFIGGYPYNWIATGFCVVIIGGFLRGKALLTLFSLAPDPLYVQKDPTVWNQPAPPAETNQSDQDRTMEESSV